MPEVKIKIANLQKVRYAFAQSPSLMTKNMRIAMGKSVKKLESTSKSFSPVDTGYLRSSHYSNFTPTRGVVGAAANYAPYVHWGTRYQRAQPFLQRAANTDQDFISDEFLTAADNTLHEIARKAK